MEEALYWTFAFNLVVNSALSFFTAIFLVEFFLFLFRIKRPRMRAVARTVPFLKMGFDLCLYRFSSWALGQGANPLLAEPGTRQLSFMFNPLAGAQLSLQDGKTFSVADVIALSVDPLWIQMTVSVAAVGAVLAVALYGRRLFREWQSISRIVQDSRPMPLPNLTPSLAAWLEKKHITCSLSTVVTSPCIVQKKILFPVSFAQRLTPEEKEAVIAHEIAHEQWKDGLSRLICSFLAAIFWWIPSNWWQKRMEETQEQASDAMIERFGISRLALAEAVLKTAQKTKEPPFIFASPFVGRQLWLMRRVQKILSEPAKPPTKWRALQWGLLFCSLLTVFFGRLWIF